MAGETPQTLEWIIEPVESGPVVTIVIESAPGESLGFEIVGQAGPSEAPHIVPV